MPRVLPLFLMLSACASDPTTIGDLGTGDLAPASCADPDPAPGSVCPVTVQGLVVDETQAAIGDRVVSVCAGLCFFGGTDATGHFSVTPDAHIILDQYAVELHGRPDLASYYTPLPNGAASTTLSYPAPLFLPKMPATGPAIADDDSGQTITSGDLRLGIAAGTHVLFSVEDFGVDHGHELRVLRVDDPTKLPFVDANEPPAALYACSPFETGFSDKVALSFLNARGLPAGSAVEILVLSGLVNDAPPAGRWIHGAAAHVTADGTAIDTDPGEGVLELTWFALRKL